MPSVSHRNERRRDDCAECRGPGLDSLRMPEMRVRDERALLSAAERRPLNTQRGTSSPFRQNGFGVGRFDLNAVAAVIDLEQGIVTCVGGAADGIPDQYDAISEVDRADHGCEHADIGLRPRNHQTIRSTVIEMLL
jgi:hypothetical protein